MQRVYSSHDLDKNFITLLEIKGQFLKERYSGHIIRSIYLDNAMKMGYALFDLKPKSKMRENKKKLFKYLDIYVFAEKDKIFTDKEMAMNAGEHLHKLATSMSDYGFRTKSYWFFLSLFGLALDGILTLVGIAKFYYYVPIFFIIVSYRLYKRERKAEKEGKLLRF